MYAIKSEPPNQPTLFCLAIRGGSRYIIANYVAEGTVNGTEVRERYDKTIENFLRYQPQVDFISDFDDPAWFLNAKTLRLFCPGSPFAKPKMAEAAIRSGSPYYLFQRNIPLLSREAGILMGGGADGKAMLRKLGIKPIRIEKLKLTRRHCKEAKFRRD